MLEAEGSINAKSCKVTWVCTLHKSVIIHEKFFKVPKWNLKSVGEHQVPSVWNCLPANLQNLSTLSNFKAQLKTHLFPSFNKHPHKSKLTKLWVSVCVCGGGGVDDVRVYE